MYFDWKVKWCVCVCVRGRGRGRWWVCIKDFLFIQRVVVIIIMVLPYYGNC